MENLLNGIAYFRIRMINSYLTIDIELAFKAFKVTNFLSKIRE